MFRLVFAALMVLYLWLGSFIPDAAHQVVGERHVFVYSGGATAHSFASALLFAGAAVYLWRARKDKVAAAIFLAGIPLIGFTVWPQIFLERTEVTPTTLIHRREPPHAKYNADIALDQIQSVVEERLESGSFGTYYRSRYEIEMKDGRRLQLPACQMLTAARELIKQTAENRKIPYETRLIPRPK